MRESREFSLEVRLDEEQQRKVGGRGGENEKVELLMLQPLLVPPLVPPPLLVRVLTFLSHACMCVCANRDTSLWFRYGLHENCALLAAAAAAAAEVAVSVVAARREGGHRRHPHRQWCPSVS